jgi:hypothetical protein
MDQGEAETNCVEGSGGLPRVLVSHDGEIGRQVGLCGEALEGLCGAAGLDADRHWALVWCWRESQGRSGFSLSIRAGHVGGGQTLNFYRCSK